MELIDVLDDEGNPTGVIKSRKTVHEKGLWHRVVQIWIMNSKGELLLQKRAATKTTNPNLWAMSCEGHISAGQNSLDGALRELKEELGLDVNGEDLVLLTRLKNNSVHHSGSYFSNHFIDLYFIEHDLDETKLNLQEDEVSAVRWMHYKDLEKRIMNGDPGHDTEYKYYKSYPQFFKFLHAKLP